MGSVYFINISPKLWSFPNLIQSACVGKTYRTPHPHPHLHPHPHRSLHTIHPDHPVTSVRYKKGTLPGLEKNAAMNIIQAVIVFHHKCNWQNSPLVEGFTLNTIRMLKTVMFQDIELGGSLGIWSTKTQWGSVYLTEIDVWFCEASNFYYEWILQKTVQGT